ncbi:unnamed protein product [Wickerhamomyces anomalus]
MRPANSRTSSQDPNVSNLKGVKAWGLQDQTQQQQQQQQQQHLATSLNDPTFQQPSLQQPSSFVTQAQKNGNGSRVYSFEDLLKIWQEIQEKIKNGESVESYRSLSPIKSLVEQVERDRSFQSDLKKDDPQVSEITEKLNEITRWAKNEKPTPSATTTAGGLASLLNKDASTASPFLAQKSLLNDHPLHSPYGNTSTDVPLAQNSLSLLQPHQIKWFYLDQTGNQQGPFDGNLMQNWYMSGYLAPDLNLRREDEYTYYSLQNFILSVNSYQQPFLVPLPDLTPKPQSVPFQHSLSFEQQLPGFFNQGIPQAQSQFGQVQNVQQNWSTNSGHSSPWVSQTNLASEVPIATQDFRIGTQSPFMNTSFNNQSTSSLARASVDTASNEHDELLDQIHSKVLNNVLEDEIQPQTAEPVVEKQKVEESIKVPEPKETAPIAAAQKAVSTPSNATQQQTKPASNGHVATASASETAKLLKPEAPVAQQAPKLAPWANKSVSNAPQLTLEQIQRLEAEESEKQAKAKAKHDKILAAQLLANTEKTIKETEASKKILPSTSSWGTPTKATPAPTKTLLDIQREEEAAAAAQAAQAAAALAASTSSSSGSTPMKKAPSAKGSFASIATSSAPPANAWTVVSSNRKPAPKPAPKITTAPKPITPEVLRNVSASTAAQVQPSSTYTKTISPRQDFLSWCRTSMKLNKGVNKDEVLQIMLMLPVGSESSEIIADTIYSNSSTMDGRRFAQEFMKRRKAVEDQAHDGLSWNEALRISAENDDDGWDFQVVGKKKKGRN